MLSPHSTALSHAWRIDSEHFKRQNISSLFNHWSAAQHQSTQCCHLWPEVILQQSLQCCTFDEQNHGPRSGLLIRASSNEAPGGLVVDYILWLDCDVHVLILLLHVLSPLTFLSFLVTSVLSTCCDISQSLTKRIKWWAIWGTAVLTFWKQQCGIHSVYFIVHFMCFGSGFILTCLVLLLKVIICPQLGLMSARPRL